MATLTDYQRLVRLKGYDGATDSQVNDAINEGRRRLARDHRWSFQDATNGSLVTAANTATVALSGIADLQHVDAVRVASAGVEYDLDPLTYQQLRDLQVSCPEVGVPRYWARRVGVLHLYPTPNAVFTLSVDYVAKLAQLTSGSDPVFPDELQDLVVWAAVPALAFRQRDGWAAPTAENNYLACLRMAVSEDNIHQRQQSDQVQPYWGR